MGRKKGVSREDLGSLVCRVGSDLRTEGYKLADDRILRGIAGPCKIDILIGANMVWKMLGTKQVASKSGIRAMKSKLGWLLLGQDEAVVKSQATANNFMLQAKQGSTEETEKAPTMEPKTTE